MLAEEPSEGVRSERGKGGVEGNGKGVAGEGRVRGGVLGTESRPASSICMAAWMASWNEHPVAIASGGADIENLRVACCICDGCE